MPKQRVPRTRCGERWTEAKFWGFLRSNLRLASRKWSPIQDCYKSARRDCPAKRKRHPSQKYEYQCWFCEEWFPRKDVQVDHIVPTGSLRSWKEFKTFGKRLFCEEDGLRVLCTCCHYIKTHNRCYDSEDPVKPFRSWTR